MDYVLYFADCETTGLDSHAHDIIELSLLRLDDELTQKTWWLKPVNPDNIDIAALKINGHRLEDLLHETKEGRERYLDPTKVIIDIENWIMDDRASTEQRVLVGHNVSFDKERFQQLWKRCNSPDTFPFGRRTMDTMTWALMMDYACNTMSESYSLSGQIKKYGIKNSAAHTAAADTIAAKDLFLAQIRELRNKLNIKI